MKILSQNESVFFVTARVLVQRRGGYQHGTAFFVARTLRQQPPLQFLVTARHLVEDATGGDIYLLPAGDDGPSLKAPTPFRWARDIWSYHPDPDIDIAVAPLSRIQEGLAALEQRIAQRYFPENDFLPKWERSDYPMLEAIRRPQPITEVLIVGYPGRYFDHENGLPIVRRGLTASLLSVDFENRPVFLVDAEIIPGSSGSPVFYVDTSNNPPSFTLLGIVSEVLRWKPHDWIPRPDEADRQLIHLGAVYKAHTITETINSFIQEKAG